MLDPLKFCCFQVLGKLPFSCLLSLLEFPIFDRNMAIYWVTSLRSSHSGNHPGLQRCSFPCAHLHSHGHGRRFTAGLAQVANAAGPLHAALEHLGVSVGHQRCVSLTLLELRWSWGRPWCTKFQFNSEADFFKAPIESCTTQYILDYHHMIMVP